MLGKYVTVRSYCLAKCQRVVLRAILWLLSSWEPMKSPRDGCTIIIACTAPLARMLGATLQMLDRQNMPGIQQIIVVFDQSAAKIGFPVEQAMRERFPRLPLVFAFYTPLQAWVMSMISWGWAYSWLSWSIGIARMRTRYGFLQDFDALLLRSDFIEERYQTIRERHVEYLGLRNYKGGGVVEDDGVVITPEMTFDAQFVRRHFRPLDLFNHVTRHEGRTVDFDTFLYAQATAGRSSVLPLNEGDWVHPSQMICQFTAFMGRGELLNARRSNLLLIPYFMFLSGRPEMLEECCQAIQAGGTPRMPFFGRQLSFSALERQHVDWLYEQAIRVETALDGGPREPVVRYFDAIRSALSCAEAGVA